MATEQDGRNGSPPPPPETLSIGSRFQFGVFHVLLRLGARRGAYGLVALVVLWYTLFYPSVRKRGRPYLSRRFPGRTGALPRLLDSYRHSLAFGKVLVDRALAANAGADAVRVTLDDDGALSRLCAEGRGLVLLNSHVGGWQVAMTTLGALGRPVHLIMQAAPRDFDRGATMATAGHGTVRVIDPAGFAGGTSEAAAALLAGDIVGVMGDRSGDGRAPTVAVPFLGDTIRVPVAAYRLASATGAPIAVLLCRRAGPFSHSLRLAATLRVPPGLGRSSEAYREWSLAYVRELEAFVRERPYEFFNFDDLWS